MPLFNIPERTNRTQDILNKVKKPAPKIKGGITSQIDAIKTTCAARLGKYKDDYATITDINDLKSYIDKTVENGVISIDTETTGLDPMQDKIAGICLYTPDSKGIYVPINHKSVITGVRFEPQLTAEQVKPEIERLKGLKVIMFNAAFDIRVIEHQIGVKLLCYFDCYLAARCLNENEESNQLKHLHKKYCLNGEGDAWTFGDLFRGVSFVDIPLDVAYLYAARDAEITYELFKYQEQFLNIDSDKCKDSLIGVANVFWNVEMPCIDAIVEMEDNGIMFDFDKQAELSTKYHKLLDAQQEKCYSELSVYQDKIQEYMRTNKNHKLSNPINLSSPTQLAILLYDIIKVESVDNKSPRGTGEAILRKINLPICNAILEYRTLDKLIGTYIDKLPKCVNPNDGRIHCKFNQYGADTGRMSSSDPNLQNIPSHNKDIRQMFKAQDGYCLLSSDYSQQEPKCLAALCALEGDRQLLDTFLAGKDLYSEIAAVSFGYPYEECKEFNSDGSTNKEGKERRTQAKSILLGILYGRGIESIAEQLNCSREKAQSIKDKVFKGFPAIKKFEAESIQMAKDLGYVTTICGRKRRLPDMELPEYEFSYVEGKVSTNTDLLDFEADDINTDVPDSIINKYWNRLIRTRYRSERIKVIQDAAKEGIKIKDNNGFIAEATRQCVNSRIQGSAADLTKMAAIRLSLSQELKSYGFRLLVPVHDELIAECPLESVKVCSRMMADIMSKTAEGVLGLPIACDVSITDAWYGNSIIL